MARQYKLVVDRDGVSAKLFVHDDNKVEIIDADNMIESDYLSRKQKLLTEVIALMRQYDVQSWKCTWEG